MKHVLDKLQGKKVLVLGDLMLDEYVYGEVTRISPEAPVPIVRVLRRVYSLGGAANVAAGLAALGANPTLIGICQFDKAGLQLKAMLEEHGIEHTLVTSHKPTTVKTRVIGHQQQMLRIDEEDTFPHGDSLNRRVREGILAALKGSPCAVIVSDYAKGVVNQEVLGLIRCCGVPWVVDPKPIHKEFYRGATALTPNMSEMLGMCGKGPLEQEGHYLIDELGLKGLLITRGEHGMLVCEGGSSHSIPTVAQEVFDVSGAGDTVIATFSAALGVGASWIEAAKLANVAAGIAVGKLGTSTVSRDELLARL